MNRFSRNIRESILIQLFFPRNLYFRLGRVHFDNRLYQISAAILYQLADTVKIGRKAGVCREQPLPVFPLALAEQMMSPGKKSLEVGIKGAPNIIIITIVVFIAHTC